MEFRCQHLVWHADVAATDVGALRLTRKQLGRNQQPQGVPLLSLDPGNDYFRHGTWREQRYGARDRDSRFAIQNWVLTVPSPLTNKAGMCFSFMGIELATPHSIKDYRLGSRGSRKFQDRKPKSEAKEKASTWKHLALVESPGGSGRAQQTQSS